MSLLVEPGTLVTIIGPALGPAADEPPPVTLKVVLKQVPAVLKDLPNPPERKPAPTVRPGASPAEQLYACECHRCFQLLAISAV